MSKIIKMLNYKKIVSVVTLACFIFSIFATSGFTSAVFAQSAAPVLQTVNTSPALNPSNFVIPFNMGRVTDSVNFNSDKVIVQIQDLHAHEETQRNIANILSFLDSKYKVTKIYVEGAAGDVDTSWLANISDEGLKSAIVNSLLSKGILTGSELFSVNSGKTNILKGIEDRETYLENFHRLITIDSQKDEIKSLFPEIRMILSYLTSQHYGKESKRIDSVVNKYKSGQLSFERYFSFLIKKAQRQNVYFGFYPSITLLSDIMNVQNKLNKNRINSQIASFIEELKSELPYSQYKELIDYHSKPETEGVFYFKLAEIYNKGNYGGKYSELAKFLQFISLNQAINPINLVNEERALLWEVRNNAATTNKEKELLYLNSFIDLMEGFLENKITAPEYQYFERELPNFKALWTKYTRMSELPGLEQYYSLFESFYKVNFERDKIFINNVKGSLPKTNDPNMTFSKDMIMTDIAKLLANAKEVEVVVTGGFHTQGVSRVLQNARQSYVVITPNVTQDAALADKLFAEDVVRISKYIQKNTFQKVLPSEAFEFSDKSLGAALSVYFPKGILDVISETAKEHGVDISKVSREELASAMLKVINSQFLYVKEKIQLTLPGFKIANIEVLETGNYRVDAEYEKESKTFTVTNDGVFDIQPYNVEKVESYSENGSIVNVLIGAPTSIFTIIIASFFITIPTQVLILTIFTLSVVHTVITLLFKQQIDNADKIKDALDEANDLEKHDANTPAQKDAAEAFIKYLKKTYPELSGVEIVNIPRMKNIAEFLKDGVKRIEINALALMILHKSNPNLIENILIKHELTHIKGSIFGKGEFAATLRSTFSRSNIADKFLRSTGIGKPNVPEILLNLAKALDNYNALKPIDYTNIHKRGLAIIDLVNFIHVVNSYAKVEEAFSSEYIRNHIRHILRGLENDNAREILNTNDSKLRSRLYLRPDLQAAPLSEISKLIYRWAEIERVLKTKKGSIGKNIQEQTQEQTVRRYNNLLKSYGVDLKISEEAEFNRINDGLIASGMPNTTVDTTKKASAVQAYAVVGVVVSAIAIIISFFTGAQEALMASLLIFGTLDIRNFDSKEKEVGVTFKAEQYDALKIIKNDLDQYRVKNKADIDKAKNDIVYSLNRIEEFTRLAAALLEEAKKQDDSDKYKTLFQIMETIQTIVSIPSLYIEVQNTQITENQKELKDKIKNLWIEIGNIQEQTRLKVIEDVIKAMDPSEIAKTMQTGHVIIDENGIGKIETITEENWSPYSAEIWAPYLTKENLSKLITDMPVRYENGNILVPSDVDRKVLDIIKVIESQMNDEERSNPNKKLNKVISIEGDARKKLAIVTKLMKEAGYKEQEITRDNIAFFMENFLAATLFLKRQANWEIKKTAYSANINKLEDLKKYLGLDSMAIEEFASRFISLNMPLDSVTPKILEAASKSLKDYAVGGKKLIEQGLVRAVRMAGGNASRWKDALEAFIEAKLISDEDLNDLPRALAAIWAGIATGPDIQINSMANMENPSTAYVVSPYTFDVMFTHFFNTVSGNPNINEIGFDAILQNSASAMRIKEEGGFEYVEGKVLGHGNVRDWPMAVLRGILNGNIFDVLTSADAPLALLSAPQFEEILGRMSSDSLAHVGVANWRNIGQGGGGFGDVNGIPNIMDTQISKNENKDGFAPDRDINMFSTFINVMNNAALLYALSGSIIVDGQPLITWNEVEAISKGDDKSLSKLKGRIELLTTEQKLQLSNNFIALLPSEYVKKTDKGKDVIQWELISGMLHGALPAAINKRKEQEGRTDKDKPLSLAYVDRSMNDAEIIGGSPLFAEVKTPIDLEAYKNPVRSFLQLLQTQGLIYFSGLVGVVTGNIIQKSVTGMMHKIGVRQESPSERLIEMVEQQQTGAQVLAGIADVQIRQYELRVAKVDLAELMADTDMDLEERQDALVALSEKLNYNIKIAADQQEVFNWLMVSKSLYAQEVAELLLESHKGSWTGSKLVEAEFANMQTFAQGKIDRGEMPASKLGDVAKAKAFALEWLNEPKIPIYVKQGIVRAMLEGRHDDLMYAFAAGWREFGTAGIRNQATNSSFDGVQLLELEQFAQDPYAPILMGPNTINAITLLQQTATVKAMVAALQDYVRANPDATKVKLSDLLPLSQLYKQAAKKPAIPDVTIQLTNKFKEDIRAGKVTFAYDSRLNGAIYAHMLTADLLSAGVKVDMFDKVAGMPSLVYAASRLGSMFGFLISASHSEPNYNGFKFVIGYLMSQVDPSFQQTIMAFRNLVEYQHINLDLAQPAADINAQIRNSAGNLMWLGDEHAPAGFDNLGSVARQNFYKEYYEHLSKRSPIALLENLPKEQQDKIAGMRNNMKILYSAFNGAGAADAGDFAGFLGRMGYKSVDLVKRQTERVDGRFKAFIKGWKLGMPDPGSVDACVVSMLDYLLQEAGQDLKKFDKALRKLDEQEVFIATDPDIDRASMGFVAAVKTSDSQAGNTKQRLKDSLAAYLTSIGHPEAKIAQKLAAVDRLLQDKQMITANDAWMMLAYNKLENLKKQDNLSKDKLYVIIKSHVTTSGLEDIANYYRNQGYHVSSVDTYVGFTLLAERADKLMQFSRAAWAARRLLELGDARAPWAAQVLPLFEEAYTPVKGQIPEIDEVMNMARKANVDRTALLNQLSLVSNLDIICGVEESNGYGEFGETSQEQLSNERVLELLNESKNDLRTAFIRLGEESVKVINEHVREKDGSLAAYKFLEQAVLLKLYNQTLYDNYLEMWKAAGRVTLTQNDYIRYRGAAGVAMKVETIQAIEKTLAYIAMRAHDLGNEVTFFGGKYKLQKGAEDVVIYRDWKYDNNYLGFPEEGIRFNVEREYKGMKYQIVTTFRPSGTGTENRDYNWALGILPQDSAGMSDTDMEKYLEGAKVVLAEAAADFYGDEQAKPGERQGLLMRMAVPSEEDKKKAQEQKEGIFKIIFEDVLDDGKNLMKLSQAEQQLATLAEQYALAARALKGKIGAEEKKAYDDKLKKTQEDNRNAWAEYLTSTDAKAYPAESTVGFYVDGKEVARVPRAMAAAWAASLSGYLATLVPQNAKVVACEILDVALMVGKATGKQAVEAPIWITEVQAGPESTESSSIIAAATKQLVNFDDIINAIGKAIAKLLRINLNTTTISAYYPAIIGYADILAYREYPADSDAVYKNMIEKSKLGKRVIGVMPYGENAANDIAKYFPDKSTSKSLDIIPTGIMGKTGLIHIYKYSITTDAGVVIDLYFYNADGAEAEFEALKYTLKYLKNDENVLAGIVEVDFNSKKADNITYGELIAEFSEAVVIARTVNDTDKDLAKKALFPFVTGDLDEMDKLAKFEEKLRGIRDGDDMRNGRNGSTTVNVSQLSQKGIFVAPEYKNIANFIVEIDVEAYKANEKELRKFIVAGHAKNKNVIIRLKADNLDQARKSFSVVRDELKNLKANLDDLDDSDLKRLGISRDVYTKAIVNGRGIDGVIFDFRSLEKSDIEKVATEATGIDGIVKGEHNIDAVLAVETEHYNNGFSIRGIRNLNDLLAAEIGQRDETLNDNTFEPDAVAKQIITALESGKEMIIIRSEVIETLKKNGIYFDFDAFLMGIITKWISFVKSTPEDRYRSGRKAGLFEKNILEGKINPVGENEIKLYEILNEMEKINFKDFELSKFATVVDILNTPKTRSLLNDINNSNVDVERIFNEAKGYLRGALERMQANADERAQGKKSFAVKTDADIYRSMLVERRMRDLRVRGFIVFKGDVKEYAGENVESITTAIKCIKKDKAMTSEDQRNIINLLTFAVESPKTDEYNKSIALEYLLEFLGTYGTETGKLDKVYKVMTKEDINAILKSA
ncbi:MAG: hypothetical protein FWG57_02470 [Endomicrobia bacterium]|nr:hypothetical protein [Endomicrobiia bacterium]